MSFILLFWCGEVHQEQFGHCADTSSVCVGWNLDTITVSHVAMALTPHSRGTKHRTRPQRSASRAKENCIVFQSMLVALWGLLAAETLLIKRRQTTGAVRRIPQTRRGRGEIETDGEERRGQMIKYKHVCMFKSAAQKKTQFPHLSEPVLQATCRFPRKLCNLKSETCQTVKYELQNAEAFIFWRLGSHQSRHRSSWPWPTSVCFALIWPQSFAAHSVKQNTCGCLAELCCMFLRLYRSCFQSKKSPLRTRKHVWSCVPTFEMLYTPHVT